MPAPTYTSHVVTAEIPKNLEARLENILDRVAADRVAHLDYVVAPSDAAAGTKMMWTAMAVVRDRDEPDDTAWDVRLVKEFTPQDLERKVSELIEGVPRERLLLAKLVFVPRDADAGEERMFTALVVVGAGDRDPRSSYRVKLLKKFTPQDLRRAVAEQLEGTDQDAIMHLQYEVMDADPATADERLFSALLVVAERGR